MNYTVYDVNGSVMVSHMGDELIPTDARSPNLLHGLVRKRAELAGELELSQGRVRELIKQIDHIDSTIRIFEPRIDIDSISPKPVPPPYGAFRGEVMRIILDTMYAEPERVFTTDDFTNALLEDRGLEGANIEIRRTMVKRAGACLRKMKDRGQVESVAAEGRYTGWKLVIE
ncbi:MAG TPA: hypothetical protein DIV98_07995 [Oceanicaulis sp.]|jgi:hypothetical protein|nr:hypothetical protein [Pusillimonas sp.]HCR94863.1 hypothetical protein [Oceanicaulis sp.]|tara:strand:- start:3946 stop:4461 length:516 start_codon:yes stop_codon:yes gene_type:complete